MSYDIFYKSMFLKVDNGKKFIPVFEAGTNNLYDNYNPRKRVREWCTVLYGEYKNNICLSETEIYDMIDKYREQLIDKNRFNSHYFRMLNLPNFIDVWDDKKFGYFASISIYGKKGANT